ncbi:hypothetical protein NC651_024304 [Populus alba x Populus x berolinensis]|nr:hypothetical protein NC651_024304 [Populus alba x Populus x berolinensis]
MASCSKALFSSKLDICSPLSSRPPLSLLPNFSSSFSSTTFFAFSQLKEISLRYSSDLQPSSSIINKAQTQPRRHICRAAEYKFPDPIPEFAVAETEKFKTHLSKKLTKKDIYGDSLEEVVGICTEIFSTFLHAEYGGPGTLLVTPFIDMADTVNEQGLPGGPEAARVAVKWAQAHVDNDWKEWTSGDSN